ncbi:MAG: DNA starvation/stationary phase protection protein [Mogibacterium diversum]|uniref:Dps family protein n=1 Tax=Mogibacterium diversum TaxID=114527 RepID=UPI001CAC6EBA|nr:DNA starvation/stationary phase protection protein [Mogibacterium diversum]MBF1341580.1 DNA starvation/stationary phase protection protein [Mogibacterium diversum]
MLERDFNNYIANLGVMIFKLHNIHWNVEGPQFVAVHEFTESLYDEIFEYYDAVAEHLKIYSVSPDVKMSDYLKNASIKEIDAKKFEIKEALGIVKEDLEELRKQATGLRNACDNEGWFSGVTMFEDQVNYYNKQIWFIRAILG